MEWNSRRRSWVVSGAGVALVALIWSIGFQLMRAASWVYDTLRQTHDNSGRIDELEATVKSMRQGP